MFLKWIEVPYRVYFVTSVFGIENNGVLGREQSHDALCWINVVILNRCTACRLGAIDRLFNSSKQRVYWLAETQILKASTKIIAYGTFCTQREYTLFFFFEKK